MRQRIKMSRRTLTKRRRQVRTAPRARLIGGDRLGGGNPPAIGHAGRAHAALIR